MHYRKPLGAALLAVVGLASQANIAHAWTGKMELIPGKCTKQNGRIFNCSIATTAFSGTVGETAVPMRTLVKVTKSGDCSTQYALQVSLTPVGEPTVQLPFFSTSQVLLRRKDGSNITKVTVADSSTWTKNLNVADTCKVTLDITANVIDVDTKAQAQAVIAAIQKQIDAKTAEIQNLNDLIELRGAYLFLNSIATHYYGELTSPIVQDLRDAGEVAIPGLSALANNCSANLTEADNAYLMQLMMDLPQLGSSSDWKNPDGTTMTLADAMGPKEAAIYQTVLKLISDTSVANGTTYDAQLKQASTDLETLKYKLNLAKTQLKALLA